MIDGVIEALARRDRWLVLVGLVGIATLAWLYLIHLAANMGGMTEGMRSAAMVGPRSLEMADLILMFLMWAVMMVAMMVPSAAPMILLYAALARRSRDKGHPIAATGVFTAGYIVVWTTFSAAAAAAQWALEQAALLSPLMASSSPFLGGGLMIAAGLYQITPLKRACLKHCRSPVQFLSTHWRTGPAGALRMGLEHGAYCVGCCWFLMGLLFVGGAMNLLWVAAIALFVLIEKVLPIGVSAARITGGLLVLAGAAVVLAQA